MRTSRTRSSLLALSRQCLSSTGSTSPLPEQPSTEAVRPPKSGPSPKTKRAPIHPRLWTTCPKESGVPSVDEAAAFTFWKATVEEREEVLSREDFLTKCEVAAKGLGLVSAVQQQGVRVFVEDLLYVSMSHQTSAVGNVCFPMLPTTFGFLRPAYVPPSVNLVQSLLSLPTTPADADQSRVAVVQEHSMPLARRFSTFMEATRIGCDDQRHPSPLDVLVDLRSTRVRSDASLHHLWESLFDHYLWCPISLVRLESLLEWHEMFYSVAPSRFEERIRQECIHPFVTSVTAQKDRDRLKSLLPLSSSRQRPMSHTWNAPRSAASPVPVMELAPGIVFGGSRQVFDVQIRPLLEEAIQSSPNGDDNFGADGWLRKDRLDPSVVAAVAFHAGWQHEYGEAWGAELMGRYLRRWER